MKYKVILRGIIKKLSPQLYNKLKKKGTGGTDSAIYCYSVWLRHLVLLNENGMKKIPDVVAEIGPGDSLGIGLNALITGTSKYYAFDVIKHASIEKNLKLFDEIVFLYKNKTKIPNDETLKRVKPKLKQYDFPIHILNDEYMNKMLEPNRLDRIRNAIKNIDNNKGIIIKYIVPWDSKEVLIKESVDLIYSQAVLEHIVDVENTYKVMFEWLKKGGFMSHEIDYSAHETHRKWYGHWTYPNWLWRIINYGRLYDINRYPHSYHIKLLKRSGFEIKYEQPNFNTGAKNINKKLLEEFSFTDKDYNISSCFIVSTKV